ncbi:low molecular weight protein-tyrosine-phosphatase [Paraglaciecola psychrophila]|jgi:protein-tyrosine phosphatase|uniref:protein-tyrosine-phosphatase n=1 Tax=Paraglaciecola psychrophila 170 TaxID=1129794 RepID=K7AFM3_9ALTE|nr:low molecular weight protein-tyrosine-phosphatase [Paraglaciecola psychrophila]AGH45337.1 protein tyrosine phosphatase [Paraglaciecola psychrophila 170]GAC39438.1 protein-tyrosine phosphatase [Paraglaciecola psychrophila 170]
MATNTPSVLFVCLGNICRSPSAEAVFKTKAADIGLVIEIDSAGTAGYHKGAAPDKRSQAVGMERGYSFKGLKCRKVVQQDFEKFDYILGMDNQNIASLLEACPEELQHKVTLLLSFSDAEEREVPDPYYGGKGGFEYVLDLIEQGADGFIKHLKSSTS